MASSLFGVTYSSIRRVDIAECKMLKPGSFEQLLITFVYMKFDAYLCNHCVIIKCVQCVVTARDSGYFYCD